MLDIVCASASHLDPAWDVLDRCRSALRARGIDQWDEVYPTRDTLAEDIQSARLFVALVGAECHGVVALDSRQEPEYASLPWRTGEPALVVHRLCVDPTVQRRGLGRRLMDFVETYGREKGYAGIRLDAYTGNPDSITFYRQRGYREVGQVFFPRRPLPFVCFERSLLLEE